MGRCKNTLSLHSEKIRFSLYAEEIEKARILNEELGIGIGAFQAATNIFLNGNHYFLDSF